MDDIEKKLGQRIATLRKRAGLTQVALAERVGTAMEVISRLERGVAIPSLGRLAEIAAALGVELRDLFEFGARKRTPHDDAVDQVIAALKDRPVEDVELLLSILRQVMQRFPPGR